MERVKAAAVVGLDPTPDVMLLSDRDFIFALWEKVKDAGESKMAVRLAAEEALASMVAEDHVRFITTGIHEAYKVDKQREQERADDEREARQAKAQALIAVGIPVTPELLGLSDDNFIRRVMKHPDAGPEVKVAAARALAGGPVQWREFITDGARQANARDVENEIKELEKKSSKEAQRRKELAARTDTAALFGIAPSQAMLRLGDDNFIRELLRLAPAHLKGSELVAAAQHALLSSDPADWKQFLHTSAEQAYKRDAEARRKKVADANRKMVLKVQAAAEKTGMYPNLVAAAKKALAGSDEDVAEFLKEDNLYRAARQSFVSGDPKLAADPGGRSSWYIRQSSADGGAAFVAPVDDASKQSVREDATWVVKDALNGQRGCYSFESVSKRHYYLAAQSNLRVRISPDDGSATFRKDATWCARKGVNGYWTSFELAGKPGYWLRAHQGGLSVSRANAKDKAFKAEATWAVFPPLAR
ncbi:AbfB domain-containing protein [Streptomyces halobius]|uniref:AbfB domain-containing protein n=1 Tax=Streptomyces halobius TaxID=2879846 RepID=A0ABY4MDA1_9ACTN|nr:AbfB domain-containing protein [Streptomyces halobius]UQA95693.1 AbfB domain-containing protein [Streptomyces halobius]